MDFFQFREHLVGEYAGFSRSLTRLRSDDILRWHALPPDSWTLSYEDFLAARSR